MKVLWLVLRVGPFLLEARVSDTSESKTRQASAEHIQYFVIGNGEVRKIGPIGKATSFATDDVT
jgi:hypothetical protein